MALAPAVRAAVAVLRSRTDDVLPVFFLTPAISGVARLAMLAGVAIAYGHLELTGRLEGFRAELAAMDLEQPNPYTDPEAFGEWIDAVAPLFESLLTPTVIVVIAVASVLSVFLFVAFSAVATAARLAACRATLDDERGTTAAISGARSHWLSILGLFVAEILLWGVATAIAVAAVAFASLLSPILGLIVGIPAALLWLVGLLAARLVFAFAPVAVVVDDVGVAGGIRRAAGFARMEPVDAIGYSLLAVATFVALGSITAIAAEAGGVLAAVLGFLLVFPVLGLTKTALYARQVGSIAPPSAPDVSLTSQLAGGLRRGLREIPAFVRRSPGLQAVSAALFVGGFALGWVVAAPYDGVVVASIDARLADQFPPTAAVFYAANNWTVTVSSAFSGLALGVPAAATTVFNGVLLGVYGRLETNPLELLAFVTPHGILELPAIVVAGALGLSLGAKGWHALRGRISRRELADAIERAFWVLVGLGVVLAVAGVIEGFVSPFYYRPFLASS